MIDIHAGEQNPARVISRMVSAVIRITRQWSRFCHRLHVALVQELRGVGQTHVLAFEKVRRFLFIGISEILGWPSFS